MVIAKLFRWALGLMVITLLCASCTLGVANRELLVGNDAFSRGEYQDATVHYLNARKTGGEYQAWIAYNLGNVYHSLGELDAAMELWNEAGRSQDQHLRFNVQFNRGIAFYESGHYDEAYKAFRETLELNPANMDAKLNLELTQKKLQAASGTRASPTVALPIEAREAEDAARLLEYVRRKEGRIWIPAAAHAEAPAVNDW